MSVQDWIGFGSVFGYFLVAAGLLGLASYRARIPSELLRKAYHVMACLSVFLLLGLFEHWYAAVMALGVLGIVVLTVLPLAMNIPLLRRLSIARQGNISEVVKQAMLFFGTLILLISVIWGVMGGDLRFHVAVGVAALGVGDAAAAIVGKRYGKRPLTIALFDRTKTIEGSMAMAVGSFVAVLVTLLLFTSYSRVSVTITSLLLALLASLAEAMARKGLDTVVIPVVVSFSSLGMYWLLAVPTWWSRL